MEPLLARPAAATGRYARVRVALAAAGAALALVVTGCDTISETGWAVNDCGETVLAVGSLAGLASRNEDQVDFALSGGYVGKEYPEGAVIAAQTMSADEEAAFMIVSSDGLYGLTDDLANRATRTDPVSLSANGWCPTRTPTP